MAMETISKLGSHREQETLPPWRRAPSKVALNSAEQNTSSSWPWSRGMSSSSGNSSTRTASSPQSGPRSSSSRPSLARRTRSTARPHNGLCAQVAGMVGDARPRVGGLRLHGP
eukprot:2335193-Pyramimonas_sp.AAC.1